MENSNLLIFENPEFGQVRTTLVDNEPWFVAADVCKALEIGNPRQAVSRLDDDEKLNTVINSDGIRGNPNMTIVSEPGLYSLILRSRKPEAKVFKRWITHEVIPSIRKHGAYVSDSVLDQLEEHPELSADLIQQLRDENAEAKRNRELLEQARAENAKLAPKAGYYDNFVNVDDLTCLRYTAKELGVRQNDFVRFLLDKGYLFRTKKGKLRPYAAYVDSGLFEMKEFVNDKTGYTDTQTMITPKGKETFRLLCI